MHQVIIVLSWGRDAKTIRYSFFQKFSLGRILDWFVGERRAYNKVLLLDGIGNMFNMFHMIGSRRIARGTRVCRIICINWMRLIFKCVKK